MRILFFGDLVGRPARNVLKQILPAYKKRYKADFVVANSDNLAHGRGVTKDTIREMAESGIDLLTCGDHIWDTKDGLELLKNGDSHLLCPANLPLLGREKGYKLIKVGAENVLIVNLIGRVFFQKCPDCPFKAADAILEENKGKAEIIIVDFHSEATSEKRAMGFYLDSRVSAVLGTNTHIQTSDKEILKGGTAYISDVGMVGPKNSILGCKKEVVINQMLTQIPFRYEISEDDQILVNAVVIETEKNGRAKSIECVNEVVNLTAVGQVIS